MKGTWGNKNNTNKLLKLEMAKLELDKNRKLFLILQPLFNIQLFKAGRMRLFAEP